jgi:hypothetical protein
MSNAQKTPFVKSIGAFGRQSTEGVLEIAGKSIPASVVSVSENGTIIVVNLEISDPVMTFPRITCAVATDKYARAPLRAGDKGYVVASDLYLGGMTGLGGGNATLDEPPNLSAVVFHPCGNTGFAPVGDPDKYDIQAPRGARISTDDFARGIQVGPVVDGEKNALQITGLQQAANDAEARNKQIPINGLYHNAGAVRIRLA